jgi:PKD repeat protein
MKTLLSVLFSLTFIFGYQTLNAQTTHQICVSEPEDNVCGGAGVFFPGNITIAVGDQIQFTTQFVAVSGYTGSNHTIEFTGSASNNVTLPVSSNVLNQTTTITTPAFTTPGTFAMVCTNSNHCLLSTSSCTGYSVTVQGNCPVVADFSASATEVCAGTEVTFINNSTNATDYEWQIDTSPFSTDVNPAYTFNNPGTYEINMIASDANCSESITETITVNPNPDATITVMPVTGIMEGEDVDITFTTMNTDGNTAYSWDFCDGGSGGSFATDFTYSWADMGTYCACLTLTNDDGCTNEICVNDIEVDMVNNLNQEEIGELVELYPNPNQGKFKILIHSTTVNAVKILNAQGQTLTQYDKVDIKNNEISLEQMASGSYFLIVETDQRKGSLQFIVK